QTAYSKGETHFPEATGCRPHQRNQTPRRRSHGSSASGIRGGFRSTSRPRHWSRKPFAGVKGFSPISVHSPLSREDGRAVRRKTSSLRAKNHSPTKLTGPRTSRWTPHGSTASAI